MSDEDEELSMAGEREPLLDRTVGSKKSRYRPYCICCWLCCFGWLFVVSLLFAIAVGLCIHYGLVQSGAGSLVAEVRVTKSALQKKIGRALVYLSTCPGTLFAEFLSLDTCSVTITARTAPVNRVQAARCTRF